MKRFTVNEAVNMMVKSMPNKDDRKVWRKRLTYIFNEMANGADYFDQLFHFIKVGDDTLLLIK